MQAGVKEPSSERRPGAALEEASSIERRRRTILGVPVDPLTLESVLEEVRRAWNARGHLLIGMVNAAKIVRMAQDRALREAVLAADLVLADGMAVIWAGRVLGEPLPERIAGVDLMDEILRLCDKEGRAVFLLGAKPDVLEAATAEVRRRFPRARLAGAHHGYFSREEEERIVDRIRQSGADVLLVGMSSPKKEVFLAAHGSKLGVPVNHGVGGGIDLLAGKVSRAPRSWQRLGLEWLYRVRQEPRRLWRRYLVTNLIFTAWVLQAFVARGRRWLARNS